MNGKIDSDSAFVLQGSFFNSKISKTQIIGKLKVFMKK